MGFFDDVFHTDARSGIGFIDNLLNNDLTVQGTDTLFPSLPKFEDVKRFGAQGLGELTGRNYAAKAESDQAARIIEEDAKKVQQLKDEANLKNQQNISASQAAASTRNTSAQLQQNQLGSVGPAKDFLGL